MFQHFSDEQFVLLDQVLATREYSDGEVIHSANEPVTQQNQAVMIILEGEIMLSTEAPDKGQVAVARSMKAGELMSLISFVNGGVHTATSQSRGHVKVALLKRGLYDNLTHSDPPFAAAIQYMIAKQLSRDLRMCDRRLANALHKGIKWDDLAGFVRR